ncbi:protein of unknown function [Pararobbsia alpina]|uniref:hypothetical protein n=1 Tax=Pararobbsia alpina TaxID=621374 RepID=UPI0039A762E8
MGDAIEINDFARSGKRDGYDFTVAAKGRNLPGFITSAALTQMVAQFESNGTSKASEVREAISSIVHAQLEAFPDLESVEINSFAATN